MQDENTAPLQLACDRVALAPPQTAMMLRYLASECEHWKECLADPRTSATDRADHRESLDALARLEPVIASGVVPRTHDYWRAGDSAGAFAEWIWHGGVYDGIYGNSAERRQARDDLMVCLSILHVLDAPDSHALA